jgi:hypothetical protein
MTRLTGLKLFVEPGALRSGTGKAMFVWASDVARKRGPVD